MMMMQIGKVPMTMPERLVGVRVRMRLGAVPGNVVSMLVMRIMHMRVGMCQRLVAVVMFMVLVQVQPYTGGHQ
jgi:hypothetical protein